MSEKTIKPKKTSAPAKTPAPDKCRAAEIGAKQCRCGAEYCLPKQ